MPAFKVVVALLLSCALADDKVPEGWVSPKAAAETKNIEKHSHAAAGGIAWLQLPSPAPPLVKDTKPPQKATAAAAAAPEKTQYLIGYGSLISEISKATSDPTAGLNYPVQVNGYERSWSISGKLPGFNTMFLGVEQNAKAVLNGVIFTVVTFQEYDKREYMYKRVQVPDADVIPLFDTILKETREIWMYVNTGTKERPSEKLPLVQSYVDMFMKGCIEVGQKYEGNTDGFTKDCVTMTEGWPTKTRTWIDDRVHPRRPLADEPMARIIDTLLREHAKESFALRTLEQPISSGRGDSASTGLAESSLHFQQELGNGRRGGPLRRALLRHSPGRAEEHKGALEEKKARLKATEKADPDEPRE